MYLIFFSAELIDRSNDISNNGIEELVPSTSIHQSECNVHGVVNKESTIEFVNPPFVTWIYTNHQLKCDFVCVILPIISGSQNINFVVSEDGLQLKVNYTWPPAIYNPDELSEELNIDADKGMNDPKIYALRSHLLECALTPKSYPRGSIVISLPVKVRREEGTFTKKGIKMKDGNFVYLEFTAYQKIVLLTKLTQVFHFIKILLFVFTNK